MREVEIDEAGPTINGLIDALALNEEIVLTREGHAVAKLSPLRRRWPVTLGRLEGQMRIPDDFDAPLPDDLLDLFEGKDEA